MSIAKQEKENPLPILPVTDEELISALNSTEFISQIHRVIQQNNQQGINKEDGFSLMRRLYSPQKELLTLTDSRIHSGGRQSIGFTEDESKRYQELWQQGFFVLFDVHTHPPYFNAEFYNRGSYMPSKEDLMYAVRLRFEAEQKFGTSIRPINIIGNPLGNKRGLERIKLIFYQEQPHNMYSNEKSLDLLRHYWSEAKTCISETEIAQTIQQYGFTAEYRELRIQNKKVEILPSEPQLFRQLAHNLFS